MLKVLFAVVCVCVCVCVCVLFYSELLFGAFYVWESLEA